MNYWTLMNTSKDLAAVVFRLVTCGCHSGPLAACPTVCGCLGVSSCPAVMEREATGTVSHDRRDPSCHWDTPARRAVSLWPVAVAMNKPWRLERLPPPLLVSTCGGRTRCHLQQWEGLDVLPGCHTPLPSHVYVIAAHNTRTATNNWLIES